MGERTKRLSRFRERRWIEQGCRCHYCGHETVLEAATVDHIVPRAYGGSDAVYNLVVACSGCNQERGHALDHCPCRRCMNAVTTFQRLRSGNRQQVQQVVYVGDKRDVAEAVAMLEVRRDRLLIHAQNEKLDDETRLSARVAAQAYDQAIGLMVTPLRVPSVESA